MPENLEPGNDDDDQYDHDFEPEQICLECGEDESNCECEEGGEIGDGEECVVCGLSQDDPVHDNG